MGKKRSRRSLSVPEDVDPPSLTTDEITANRRARLPYPACDRGEYGWNIPDRSKGWQWCGGATLDEAWANFISEDRAEALIEAAAVENRSGASALSTAMNNATTWYVQAGLHVKLKDPMHFNVVVMGCKDRTATGVWHCYVWDLSSAGTRKRARSDSISVTRCTN
jgi:hypothetical protein